MSRHDDEIRDAESRIRRAYIRVAEQIELEFANREDDYARGMHEAARRIWNAERNKDPDVDPVVALTSVDRKWLQEMGWSG